MSALVINERSWSEDGENKNKNHASVQNQHQKAVEILRKESIS